MHDLDALEAINIDQLVTRTDRLLLRSSLPERAPSRRTFDFTLAAQAAVLASAARAARLEETVFVRRVAPARRLVGIAALVGGAWLGVICACLLP